MKKALLSVVVACVLITCASVATAMPLRASSAGLMSSPRSGWVAVAYKDAASCRPEDVRCRLPQRALLRGVRKHRDRLSRGGCGVSGVLAESAPRCRGDSRVHEAAVLLARGAAGVQIDCPKRAPLVPDHDQRRIRLLLTSTRYRGGGQRTGRARRPQHLRSLAASPRLGIWSSTAGAVVLAESRFRRRLVRRAARLGREANELHDGYRPGLFGGRCSARTRGLSRAQHRHKVLRSCLSFDRAVATNSC